MLENLDLFTQFVEDPDDIYDFEINYGALDLPCPIFGENKNIVGWIPLRNYSLISSNRANAIVEKFRCTQRTVPILVQDEMFRDKTPLWTNRNLILRRLRFRRIFTKFTTEQPKCRYDHERWPPKWFDCLSDNETTLGPTNGEANVGNCLSFDESNSVLAFCDGRQHECLRIFSVRWIADDENLVECKVERSLDFGLTSPILDLQLLPGNKNDLGVNYLCRTVNDVQLITYSDDEIMSECLIPEERVRLFLVNPYIPREFCLISDAEQKFIFGSLNASNAVLCSNYSTVDQFTVTSLEWSDHPRCIFVADDNNHLFLFDVRSPFSDLNKATFWFTPTETDRIRGLKRIDDDSRYLLVATDKSLFLLDYRQPLKPLATVHHMMTDSIKYLTVSDKFVTDFGDHRLVTLTGRELNQQIFIPLIWDCASSTVCEMEPPTELWSNEHVLHWLRIHEPNLPLTTDVVDRCSSPHRGAAMKKIFENRLVNLSLNDVGDLSYSIFDFDTRRSDDVADLDFVSSNWKTFIESFSEKLTLDSQDTSSDFEILEIDRESIEDDDLPGRNSLILCKFCQSLYDSSNHVCPECRLNEGQIDDLLKRFSGEISGISSQAGLSATQNTEPDIKTLNEVDSLILAAWTSFDSDWDT